MTHDIHLHGPTLEYLRLALENEAVCEEEADRPSNAQEYRNAARYMMRVAERLERGVYVRIDLPSAPTWRDIRLGDIDWKTYASKGMRRLEVMDWVSPYTGERHKGKHADMTLGDLANAGVRWWRYELGVGEVGAQKIRDLIDRAASGLDVLKPRVAPDAYVPKETNAKDPCPPHKRSPFEHERDDGEART